jgi:hypothetical protein
MRLRLRRQEYEYNGTRWRPPCHNFGIYTGTRVHDLQAPVITGDLSDSRLTMKWD